MGGVEAQRAQQHTLVTLSHLDSRLLMDTEEGNVGYTNERPLLIGPEHDDRASLRSLGGDVKIGKANATKVRSKTNEDVPSTV